MKRILPLLALLLLFAAYSYQQTRVIGVCGPPGTGRLVSITGTNPAAGVEISETVPAGTRWRVLSMRANFTTDATVITRFPGLVVDDGTLTLFFISAAQTQAASTGVGYTMTFLGGRDTDFNADAYLNLPGEVSLGPGFRIRTLTTNLQAGDDWTAPQLLVEECTP